MNKYTETTNDWDRDHTDVDNQGHFIRAFGNCSTKDVDAAFENLSARVASFHGLIVVQGGMPVVFDAQDKVALLSINAA